MSRRVWIGAAVVVVVVIAGQSNPHDKAADTAAGQAAATPSATSHGATSSSRASSPTPSATPAASATKATKPRQPVSPSAAPAQRPTRSRAALALLAGVPVAAIPSPRLTPGKAAPVGRAAICVTGYSARVRDVSESTKDAVYARYHVEHVPYAHEIDHLVSLELGGSNTISNLWPEPYAGRWGARTKDALENKLHALVCDGRMTLPRAQHIEAEDWVSAYRTLIGTPPPGHPSKPVRIHHPTHQPAPKPSGSSGSCEPGYSPCLPVADDLNCTDLSADQTPVRVTGDDPYGLDADGDGTGCDS